MSEVILKFANREDGGFIITWGDNLRFETILNGGEVHPNATTAEIYAAYLIRQTADKYQTPQESIGTHESSYGGELKYS